MTRHAPDTFIAVDPGASTGIAVFCNGNVANTLTSEAPHDELAEAIRGHEVVCEQGPVNRLQAATCEEVEAIVRREAETIYWVRPSDWKGHPTAVVDSSDGCSNKHERDAASLGRWYAAHRRTHAKARAAEAA